MAKQEYDSDDFFVNMFLGFANIQIGDNDLQSPVLGLTIFRCGFILKCSNLDASVHASKMPLLVQDLTEFCHTLQSRSRDEYPVRDPALLFASKFSFSM